MIDVLRNEAGDITAVCEWLLFNKQGMLDDKGTILFVGEVEINNAYRGNGALRKIIMHLIEVNPQATDVFWYRNTKYPGSKPRFYKMDLFRRRHYGRKH